MMCAIVEGNVVAVASKLANTNEYKHIPKAQCDSCCFVACPKHGNFSQCSRLSWNRSCYYVSGILYSKSSHEPSARRLSSMLCWLAHTDRSIWWAFQICNKRRLCCSVCYPHSAATVADTLGKATENRPHYDDDNVSVFCWVDVGESRMVDTRARAGCREGETPITHKCSDTS